MSDTEKYNISNGPCKWFRIEYRIIQGMRSFIRIYAISKQIIRQYRGKNEPYRGQIRQMLRVP